MTQTQAPTKKRCPRCKGWLTRTNYSYCHLYDLAQVFTAPKASKLCDYSEDK